MRGSCSLQAAKRNAGQSVTGILDFASLHLGYSCRQQISMGMSVMGYWLEAFKILGSGAGLLTSGFILYDRLFRIQPDAFLIRGEYPGQVDVILRNVSNESIIIDEMSASPNLVGLAKGDSVLAIVRAVVSRREHTDKNSRSVFIVLKPLEEIRIGLIAFDSFQKASADRDITIRFSWRTSRRRFPLKRTVSIKTSVGDIAAMKVKEDEVAS